MSKQVYRYAEVGKQPDPPMRAGETITVAVATWSRNAAASHEGERRRGRGRDAGSRGPERAGRESQPRRGRHPAGAARLARRRAATPAPPAPRASARTPPM